MPNYAQQIKTDGHLLNRPPPKKGRKGAKRLATFSNNPVKRGNRLRYFKLARTFKRENPICQRCGKAPTQDCHHTKGRGANLNRVETFMSLCRACHNHIHEHPAESRALGLLL